MAALPWEIRHIVGTDDIVMVERVDDFLVGEMRVSGPCMGIFELRGGKIAAWRDYWDLRQFERQCGPARRSRRSDIGHPARVLAPIETASLRRMHAPCGREGTDKNHLAPGAAPAPPCSQ
jgi:hypothetical protein